MAKALSSGKELPPLYYLHNFDTLLNSVFEQYRDLLSEDELAYVAALQQLSDAARGLYVRLVSRVGPLFRSEKIDYPELGPLPSLAQELDDAELLQNVAAPELEQILALCRKDELLALFGANIDGAGRLKRDQLLQRIREAYTDAEEWVALWAAWYPGQLWQPQQRERIELLQLLFFGNRRQSLTDFVLSDLGLARYVDYPLDPAFRLFENREQLDEYLAIARLREIYYEAEEAGDIEALLLLVNPLCSATESPALSLRWNQLRNRVARQLEREKCLEEAQQVYRCSSDHPARERRVRILRSEGELESALQLCQQISAQPWCEAELDFALAQIPGLQKKLGRPADAIASISYSEQRLCLENTGVRVEEAVAQHYAHQWSQVYFTENVLFNALFGLCFWEEIFQPIRGAFVNPFQSSPLDMYSREFYLRRQSAIDKRLEQLESGGIAGLVLENFERYRGLSCSWVNWRYLEREMLELALEHVPANMMAAIFRRILFDPRANRSGLPDLVAFDSKRGFNLIEVKGPGDQVQANQRRWFRFFLEAGTPFEVVWVEWRHD